MHKQKRYWRSDRHRADRREARRWLEEVADPFSEARCSQRQRWARAASYGAGTAEADKAAFISRLCGRPPNVILGLQPSFGHDQVGSDHIFEAASSVQERSVLRELRSDFRLMAKHNADLAERALCACRWHLERPYLAWVDAVLFCTTMKASFRGAWSSLTQRYNRLYRQSCSSEPIWSVDGLSEREGALESEALRVELSEESLDTSFEDHEQFWNMEFTKEREPRLLYVGTRSEDGHTRLAKSAAQDVWQFLMKLLESESRFQSGESQLRDQANDALALLLELSWPRPSRSKSAFDVHDLVGYRPGEREPPWSLTQTLRGARYRESLCEPRPVRPGGREIIPSSRSSHRGLRGPPR